MPRLRLLALIPPLLSLAATAQTAPGSEFSVPPDHIRIPVLVTDKQGKAIADLHADDFKVLDNGKPAAIAAFQALSATAPSPSHFTVFYLDDRRLSMGQMKRAQQTIDAALPSALDSNGYVAIVTGTGSANSGFSRDPAQLRQILTSIQANAFAAQGNRAHNFDLIGTYASLGDYAARISKLPGRRLLVLLSPGFFSNFPEIRSAAAASIDRIIQSGVVLNAFDTEDYSSTTVADDKIALQELCSATGGTLFPATAAPPTLTRFPGQLYLLDIPFSGIRADGSTHQLKVTVSQPGKRVHARENFIAPRPGR